MSANITIIRREQVNVNKLTDFRDGCHKKVQHVRESFSHGGRAGNSFRQIAKKWIEYGLIS